MDKLSRMLNKFKFIDFVVIINFVFLSLIMTYPLIEDLSSAPYGGGTDIWENLWGMWWVKKAVYDLHVSPYYTDYIFYPDGVRALGHDFVLSTTIPAIPLQLVFDLKTVYNIMILVSFVLSGFFMYLLVKYLTNNRMAAFIAGVVYAFSPYHLGVSLMHINMKAIEWIPLYALYLIRTTRERNSINAVLAAICLLLVRLSSWYYLLFSLLFTIVFFSHEFLLRRKNLLARDTLKRVGIMVAVFTILFLPFGYPLLRESIKNDYLEQWWPQSVGSPEDSVRFTPSSASADLIGYITPPRRNRFIGASNPIWGDHIKQVYKNIVEPASWDVWTIFMGYTAILLVLYAILKVRAEKMRIWVLFLIIFFVLSLGPYLHVMGNARFTQKNIPIELPYKILHEHIDPFRILAHPHRFNIIVMLSVAVLVGFSMDRILRKYNSQVKQSVICIIIITLILTEYQMTPWFFDFPEGYSTHECYKKLVEEGGEQAVLDIPVNESYVQGYMYYQTIHERKIVVGKIGRDPRGAYDFINTNPFIQKISQPIDQEADSEIRVGLRMLKSNNVGFIIVHKTRIRKYGLERKQDMLENLVRNIQEDSLFCEDDKTIIYRVNPLE